MDDDKSRGAFTEWLLKEKNERQSRMIDRVHGEEIIKYLRDERELGDDDPYMRSNYGSTFRHTVKQRGFKLHTVVGLGDILCLPMNQAIKSSTESHAMLGQFRQVIFKEDMYDVILHAHVQGTKHLGYKGTYKKLNETYCCIPRLVVWKFVGLCDFCTVHHACYANKNKRASNPKGLSKAAKRLRRKAEISDAFLTRCQIDVIDMIKNPDGAFQYIGHFFDHLTKYSVLFALKSKDAVYVARKICRHVISHFGMPKIIYSNMPRDYIDDLIHGILQFWSTDMPIINGDPGNTKAVQFIQQRQRTIMVLIETLDRKHGNSNAWSTWLPCIQYSLNSNEFEQGMPSSCEAVFKARPRSYNYSSTSSQIPREESLMHSEDSDVQQNSEVYDVSEGGDGLSPPITPLPEMHSSTRKIAVPNRILPPSCISSQNTMSQAELSPEHESPAELIEDYSVSMVDSNSKYEIGPLTDVQ